MSKPEVRISVANLVRRVIVPSFLETRYLAVLNPTRHNKDGSKLLQLFGGGAELTSNGRGWLVNQCGARDFSGNDARFVIDEDRAEEVLSAFEVRRRDLCETDIVRELREEFCDVELDGIPPILVSEETLSISAVFAKVIRQKPPRSGDETSPSAIAGIPSRRLFYMFDLHMPEQIFDRIKESPAVRELFPAEIATTKKGTCKGRSSEGIDLADNIAIW